ncbi:right-handed parallel beta-helix repeat-containing protein [Candidatus Eisenbacteria bacterium]|uniref:Right-handed parallel beta-helix repeat-containing protein n=1 Tax=Eiseniibacteriota bacterium TaxID=2212470 RepID=A0ABV6YN04_UNCEI
MRRFLLISGITLLLLATKAPARTWYVNAEGTGDAPTIQAGIDMAGSGDIILLAPGTYSGIGNRDLDLYGKAIAVRSERGPNLTIVDCDGLGRGFILRNQEPPEAILEGLTITNGRADGAWLGGGAILCKNASPTIIDCVIEFNTGSYVGGGCVFQSSSALVRGCAFRDNSALVGGGGLWIDNSCILTVEDCVFERNEAERGGGIGVNNTAQYVIRRCVFLHNHANDGGGFWEAAPIQSIRRIEESVFYRNDAARGGGLFLSGSESVSRCTIAENSATSNGSGVFLGTPYCNIFDSIVAFGEGGAGICYLYGLPERITLEGNNVFGNQGGNYGVSLVDRTGVDGNISVDPRFCDLGAGDLSLQSDSPCADDGGGARIGALPVGCAGVPWYFVHISDTHVDLNYCHVYLWPLPWNECTGTSHERLTLLLNAVRQFDPQPAFVLISGDIVDVGDWQSRYCNPDYAVFKSLLSGDHGSLFLDDTNRVPVYVCPGNHDYYDGGDLGCYDDGLGFPVDQQYGVHCYCKTYADSRVLSLDSGRDTWRIGGGSDFTPESDGLDGNVSRWLGEALNSAGNKIAFMHHPVFSNKAGYQNNGCITENREGFIGNCVDGLIGLVLHGHLHNDGGAVFALENGEVSDISGQYDGYAELDGNPGREHFYTAFAAPDSYFRTLFVETPDTRGTTAYRTVWVHGDEIRVSAYSYVKKVVRGRVIWGTGPWQVKTSSEGVASLHIYDSLGRHLGPNESGGLDSEIEGGVYMPLWASDSTIVGVDGSVFLEGEDLVIEIQAKRRGWVSFSCAALRGSQIGEAFWSYDSVAVDSGSVCRAFVLQDSIDYTLHIDDNNDGIYDREIRPSDLAYRNVPHPPSIPRGPAIGLVGCSCSYVTLATDPEADSVYYTFDWGDGTISTDLGPGASGEDFIAGHAWSDIGKYRVRVRARDTDGYVSDWSEDATVRVLRANDEHLQQMSLVLNPVVTKSTVDVSYSVPYRCHLTISAFDVLGRRVAVIADGESEGGSGSVSWDASSLESGIFFCRMEAGGMKVTRKLVVLRQ